MRRLFDEFDQVRIINLRERTDRKAAVLSELAQIGILDFGSRISFFAARRPPSAPDVQDNVPANGALISHREVIREALQSGANSLLILEDDVFFRRRENRAVGAIVSAMRTDPWDVIYFGYLEPDEGRRTDGPLAAWNGRVIGGHFCGMNRRFMERILAFMDGFGRPGLDGTTSNPVHRDGAFNLFIEKNPDVIRKLAVPCLAIQRSSRTDLHRNRIYDRAPILRGLLEVVRSIKNGVRRR
jgi:hypothetical protein